MVKQIKSIGADPGLLQEVLIEARRQDEAASAELKIEQQSLESELHGWHVEMQSLSLKIKPGDDNGTILSRLADLQERIAAAENRLRMVREQIDAVRRQALGEEEAAVAMTAFDPVWGALSTLLVQRRRRGCGAIVGTTFPEMTVRACIAQGEFPSGLNRPISARDLHAYHRPIPA